MENIAAQQLSQEAHNWLNEGRVSLLQALLTLYAPGQAGDVLELGPGPGQNLVALHPYGAVDVVEISSVAWPLLSANEYVRLLYKESVPDLQLETQYQLICAMDVLEHIEDDKAALAWINDRLMPSGTFIATVPAYQWMFSDHDIANQHYRRYTRPALVEGLQQQFEVVTSGYFNSTLFPLAILSRCVWMGRRHLLGKSDSQQKQSSQLPTPIARIFRSILEYESRLIKGGFRAPFGLSVYAVARKRSD